MQLELTQDEADTLRDYLGRRLGDLSVEIRHTDNRDYRRVVRSERDVLRRVYDALMAEPGGTSAAPTD